MVARKIIWFVAWAIGLCLQSTTAFAQDIPRAFLCRGLTGVWLGAPAWKPEADAMTGQEVLLSYTGKAQQSEVKWYRDGKVYFESPGIGVPMNGGFAIVVLGDEYLETYVFNSGTTELLMSATRSGSSALPNSIKSQRGVCKAAGAMVR